MRGNHSELREVASTKEASAPVCAPIVVLTQTHARPQPIATADFPGDGCRPGADKTGVCVGMTSSCGDSEGCAGETACPSQLPADSCPDLLHQLSNLLTGVLLNAQLLEWKLPPYSHLKRPVREVARNAQRGSELLKRLVLHCAARRPESQACTDGGTAALRQACKPPRTTAAADILACGLPQVSGDLTTQCDSRTSRVFPKRDDRDGQ
jgi:hypothetical protein